MLFGIIAFVGGLKWMERKTTSKKLRLILSGLLGILARLVIGFLVAAPVLFGWSAFHGKGAQVWAVLVTITAVSGTWFWVWTQTEMGPVQETASVALLTAIISVPILDELHTLGLISYSYRATLNLSWQSAFALGAVVGTICGLSYSIVRVLRVVQGFTKLSGIVSTYVRKATTTLCAFGLVYAGLVVVFAGFYAIVYRGVPNSFKYVPKHASLSDFVFYSVMTMSAQGQSPIRPTSTVAQLIVSAEVLVSLVLIVLVLGAVVAHYSQGDGLVASRHRVQCINRSNRTDSHERITNIGGVDNDGSRWKLAEEEAIAAIERNGWEFYVHAGSATIDVIVATRLGRKYLKTKNDGETPNNLLALPECPYSSSKE
jgi:Protein of unknown function (DUF3892)